jgi:hypothetical protein
MPLSLRILRRSRESCPQQPQERPSPGPPQVLHVVAQKCFRFESGLPGPSGSPGRCLIHMKTRSTWRPQCPPRLRKAGVGASMCYFVVGKARFKAEALLSSVAYLLFRSLSPLPPSVVQASLMHTCTCTRIRQHLHTLVPFLIVAVAKPPPTVSGAGLALGARSGLPPLALPVDLRRPRGADS